MSGIRLGGIAVLGILLAGLTGCGGNKPTAPLSGAVGVDMDLRSKNMVNEAAYIPPMCWTKTEGANGAVHNACYTCHTKSVEPNYSNDQELQLSYDFPEYARTNRWSNLFQSREAKVAAISDGEILQYVRQNNYSEGAKTILVADVLKNVPKGWDFNGNGRWDGYTPDAYFAFDGEGFDKQPGGGYTGWRAFAYHPLPSTFWPTNGSTDDVLIRLDAPFRNSGAGTFDLATYKINLAIVEALIKRSDVPIEAVDEHRWGVDLDKNGTLGRATKVRYDWAPKQGRTMSFVGQAAQEQAAGRVHLAAGLYPEGTEFLHSVRYLDVTQAGAIALAPRMKELRYAKKRSWLSYLELQMAAGDELKEKYDYPDRLSTFIGDVEQGLSNGQGWVYAGFIEDSRGNLRPQSYEETTSCMGCHSGLGVTTDGTFAFPRKKEAREFQEGWYHWSQKALQGPGPKVEIEGVGVYPEYAFYLMYNKAGDELRENREALEKFFTPSGEVKADKLKELNDDATLLLNPSPQRALTLNKAYRTIVAEQSFIHGRDATVIPAANVHKTVTRKQTTGIAKEVNTLGTGSSFNGPRIAANTAAALPPLPAQEATKITGASMGGPDGKVYSVAPDGLIYKSSYSMEGVAFPFPDRLTVPAQTIVPLSKIPSCYSCHRLDYAVPAENLAGRALYAPPVLGGSEEGKLQRLTEASVSDTTPRWNPDGSRLAWVSGAPGSTHLWVMNSDGSGKQQVTTASGMQAWPEWSPDGSRLVYWEYVEATQRYALRTIRPGGTSIITLAESTNILDRPTWRPDGQYLAYAEERGGDWDVWVVQNDGAKSWRMTRTPAMETNPLWSPDRMKIAYKVAASGTYNLTEEYFLDVSAGFDAPVVLAWEGPQSIQMSGWSPDGSRIVYTAEAVSGTSGQDRVSYLAALSEVSFSGTKASATHSEVLSAVTLGDRGAVFSPDGQKVAFWGWDPSFRALLWIYDLESKQVQRLTTEGFDFHPRWSPDSRRIAFESNRGGSLDIWVVAVE